MLRSRKFGKDGDGKIWKIGVGVGHFRIWTNTQPAYEDIWRSPGCVLGNFIELALNSFASGKF